MLKSYNLGVTYLKLQTTLKIIQTLIDILKQETKSKEGQNYALLFEYIAMVSFSSPVG